MSGGWVSEVMKLTSCLWIVDRFPDKQLVQLVCDLVNATLGEIAWGLRSASFRGPSSCR